jgi:hypothetical protein
MDYIERIFGISPDGGSGVLEMLLFCAGVAISALVMWKARARRRA